MNLVTFDNSALIVESYLSSYPPACFGSRLNNCVYSATCNSLPECLAHALDYDNIVTTNEGVNPHTKYIHSPSAHTFSVKDLTTHRMLYSMFHFVKCTFAKGAVKCILSSASH